MKVKILIVLPLVLAASAFGNRYFNNSVDRWEADCNVGMETACGIAGNMYMRGEWENAADGKMVKIEGTRAQHIKAAKKLLKRGCKLGHKKACSDYKKFFGKK